jgi:hypothetical protein
MSALARRISTEFAAGFFKSKFLHEFNFCLYSLVGRVELHIFYQSGLKAETQKRGIKLLGS